MIPKIIHYCWFGGKPLPDLAKKCIDSWKKYCPDFRIIRWDESNFDVNSHPFMKKAYECRMWAFVSDYARLKVIYDNGGIYLDTDVELLKKPELVMNDRCFAGRQQKNELIATGLGFGAEKGHPMVKAMMDEYEGLEFDLENRMRISCPVLNTTAFEKHGFTVSDQPVDIEGTVVYPPEYFDPYPSGGGRDMLTENTISIHHYSASWTTGKQRWKRKIARIAGEGRILKIKELIKKFRRTDH